MIRFHNNLRRSVLSTFCLLLTLFSADTVFAQQKASWIMYPGDYEVWLGNKMQNRRTERGAFLPPFWKLDSQYPLIEFHKDFELTAPETAKLYVEGQYNVKLDGKAFSGYPKSIEIPAGKHRISLKVFNQANVPAVFVQGKTLVSDTSWRATFEDKEWIDASGKASDISATKYLSAESWNFADPLLPPSQYKLPVKAASAVKIEKKGNRILLDFGKETFGYIKLNGLKGEGKVSIYYGESKEEALSTDSCETLDYLDINYPQKKDSVMNLTKAFRYVNVQFDPSISIDQISMLVEYAPVADRGKFTCSDPQINKIYDVANYTLRLATREFFIDGIKRDRWVWSGDAYQSYLMNYYSFFDSPTVTRTLLALRGKDLVTSHINTIMDYTFYWFMGIHDYYQYTGDKKFIEQFYSQMQSLMDYCLSRRDKNGFMEGQTGDWVFVDWADGLSKKGALSFEQLLLCRSLETMAQSAEIMKDAEGSAKYKKLADDLKTKIFATYWNPEKHALVHSVIDGKQTENVTRYANMFSIFFNYFNEEQKQQVKQHVLLNDNVQKIITPYMRFYELEALCAMGEQKYVLKQMKDYWGGMLNLGATSFWEEYNPGKKGVEHYAMYGRPFGKSLCHAWGASPIYLLGKYYLGVSPTSPGYQNYIVQPELGGLHWIQGSVPTPNGDIQIYCSTKKITVKGASGTGLLRFKSKSKPVCKDVTIQPKGNYLYEMSIRKGAAYSVDYTAL